MKKTYEEAITQTDGMIFLHIPLNTVDNWEGKNCIRFFSNLK